MAVNFVRFAMRLIPMNAISRPTIAAESSKDGKRTGVFASVNRGAKVVRPMWNSRETRVMPPARNALRKHMRL
jgi:hypothetical protein